MSNYPAGVSDDDFIDNMEYEEEPLPMWLLDAMRCEAIGEPWPRDATEAAMCTPITLWNSTMQNIGR